MNISPPIPAVYSYFAVFFAKLLSRPLTSKVVVADRCGQNATAGPAKRACFVRFTPGDGVSGSVIDPAWDRRKIRPRAQIPSVRPVLGARRASTFLRTRSWDRRRRAENIFAGAPVKFPRRIACSGKLGRAPHPGPGKRLAKKPSENAVRYETQFNFVDTPAGQGAANRRKLSAARPCEPCSGTKNQRGPVGKAPPASFAPPPFKVRAQQPRPPSPPRGRRERNHWEPRFSGNLRWILAGPTHAPSKKIRPRPCPN